MDKTELGHLHGRLLDNLPGMAYRCLHDAAWTLEYVSSGSVDLLGYTPVQLVGADRLVTVSDLTHPEDLAYVSLGVERALSKNEPFDLVYRMRTASGETKHVHEIGRGLFNEAGDLLALEGFLTDATDSVNSQEVLRRAQKREVVGKLASGIAHDFNNLLTVIFASTELLAPGIDEDSRGYLDAIKQVAEQAAKLTRQLMSLAKPSSAPAQPVDVGRVLTSHLPVLRTVAGDRVAVRLERPDEVVFAQVDPLGLEQVLFNLTHNAKDAILDKGTIEIRLRATPEAAIIEVEDDGPGLAPELQERIFDPFFSSKGDRGTGLGLAVVDEVVKSAQGTITVESSPGAGATFRVTLPRVTSATGVAQPTARPLGAETILLVDDDDAVRRVLAQGLRRFGYTVLESSNGEQALKLSERHKGPLDVLITDAKMPRMGGNDLAHVFSKQRPDVPMILISGDGATPNDLFTAFLSKPLTAETLAKEARSQVDRKNLES